ncbi:DUF3006 domain-containing protein [Clostridium chauvoei]|uniref:Uncharacterized protein n=2 Tax=Clostridium chauvoei TaxID=46867 RepID=S6FIW4_9CLOT|nr:DUF3006 domain-containing protein [Clostridium chauvoei]ATD54137.1 hypothetical protein BTM20_02380 [Clostridium chauvoei]ATD58416.1 hypothetical protein BTM21_12100 [Clostridium chauvoei]MBX7281676.1 DUF3006 domain-containing protein [Clostridium chauvoei]MBX7284185.1 DUF3006 domain-containing protein [Clostridium chauvoei]MBX7286713.1 DUF3006 domain-containing protein [Clostridium chauvoei]
MNNFTIDRIEGEYAVLETELGDFINIKKDLIDGKFNEGDILVKKGDRFKVDDVLTKNRREYIKNMMKGMWE